MFPKTRLRFALASALAVPASVLAAERTARTDAICKQSLDQRQALAAKGDPDGIYCLAVLYAARYGDERYSDAERAGYGANARIYIKRAAALGYRVGDIERDIVGGDNITNTGSYFGRRKLTGKMVVNRTLRCCAAQCGATAQPHGSVQRDAWRR